MSSILKIFLELLLGTLAQLQHQLAARSGKRNFSLQLS